MDPGPDAALDRGLKLAVRLWTAITASFVLINGALFLIQGVGVFGALVQQGPFSLISLTLPAVAIIWLSLGAALIVLRSPGSRTRYGLTVVCTFFVMALYTNILRERISYGDFVDYLRAAHSIAGKVAFNDRYLYPPLTATILAYLLPLGDMTVACICWVANILALGVFSVLLPIALGRYGLGSRLSTLLTALFIIINVPILRTLGYLQMNLHVANLILLSLLTYPRLPFVSALALALSVHLKTSPLILALPFLLNRDWRWTASFVVLLAVLAEITNLQYGLQPFSSFLHNASHIYSANQISFRETSLDSLFRSSARVLGIDPSVMFWPIAIAKAIIVFAAILVLARALRNDAFVGRETPGHVVYNAFPVVMVPMLLLSPLVWEHHPVLVSLSYLLVVKLLRTPIEWVLYGLAYTLEYLLPTFDFFPWSFGRLLSPLVLLCLIYWSAGKRPRSLSKTLRQWG